MVERDNLKIAEDDNSSNEQRSAREIREDIAAKRESISETVDRLSDKVQRTFDWRTYAGDYPLVAIGLAAGVGFLVSRIFTPKPTPRERILDAIAETVEDMKGRIGDYVEAVPLKKKGGISNTVKAAAVGALTKAATDYAKNKIGLGQTRRQGANDNGRSRLHDTPIQ
jgi:ElaB/YqjD/DUF883 family membrane-anchored ribosome-binding protein